MKKLMGIAALAILPICHVASAQQSGEIRWSPSAPGCTSLHRGGVFWKLVDTERFRVWAARADSKPYTIVRLGIYNRASESLAIDPADVSLLIGHKSVHPETDHQVIESIARRAKRQEAWADFQHRSEVSRENSRVPTITTVDRIHSLNPDLDGTTIEHTQVDYEALRRQREQQQQREREYQRQVTQRQNEVETRLDAIRIGMLDSGPVAPKQKKERQIYFKKRAKNKDVVVRVWVDGRLIEFPFSKGE